MACKTNNLREMFKYLDKINDPKEPEYDYCKEESYGLLKKVCQKFLTHKFLLYHKTLKEYI